MISENVAILLGSFASALRYRRQGFVFCLQIFISSAGLSFYVGPEVVELLYKYAGITVGFGAVLFLLAYYGSEVLSKGVVIIRAFRVSKKWKL